MSRLMFHALVLVALPLISLAALGGVGQWAGVTSVPAIIFGVIVVLYLIHVVLAFYAARDSVTSIEGEDYSYNLFDCIEYYDGKLVDAWVYAAISLVFPVFLSVFIDTSSFRGRFEMN